MEAARTLRLVSENDDLMPWPETGEGLTPEAFIEKTRGVLYENEGLTKLTKKQARENARLEKRVAEDEDPMNHAKGKEIVGLVERWMRATGHTRSKVSGDRVKYVKARLADGYTIEQIELAIDGLGAFPYVHMGQRVQQGSKGERHDRLGIALGGGEPLEKFAVLGHEARRRGLVTWDEEKGNNGATRTK